MKQEEFGKEIQRLNKLYFEKTGKPLEVLINLERNEISCAIYKGALIERKRLIEFLEDKINKL